MLDYFAVLLCEYGHPVLTDKAFCTNNCLSLCQLEHDIHFHKEGLIALNTDKFYDLFYEVPFPRIWCDPLVFVVQEEHWNMMRKSWVVALACHFWFHF